MKYFLCIFLLIPTILPAQVKSIEINTPKDWFKEIINLPPGFAPDMKFRGKEDIRFAPGMFKPEEKDFFTYVFLLDGKYGEKFDQKAVESEILKYYKGLGKAVGGKKFNVDPSKFEIKLTSEKKGEYKGTLKWKEPFRTGKDQTLNLQIYTWDSPEKQFLFAMVSPAALDSEVWKSLKEVYQKLTIK